MIHPSPVSPAPRHPSSNAPHHPSSCIPNALLKARHIPSPMQISRLEAQAEYERSRDRAAALAEKEGEAEKDKARLESIKVGGGGVPLFPRSLFFPFFLIFSLISSGYVFASWYWRALRWGRVDHSLLCTPLSTFFALGTPPAATLFSLPNLRFALSPFIPPFPVRNLSFNEIFPPLYIYTPIHTFVHQIIHSHPCPTQ